MSTEIYSKFFFATWILELWHIQSQNIRIDWMHSLEKKYRCKVKFLFLQEEMLYKNRNHFKYFKNKENQFKTLSMIICFWIVQRTILSDHCRQCLVNAHIQSVLKKSASFYYLFFKISSHRSHIYIYFFAAQIFVVFWNFSCNFWGIWINPRRIWKTVPKLKSNKQFCHFVNIAQNEQWISMDLMGSVAK